MYISKQSTPVHQATLQPTQVNQARPSKMAMPVAPDALRMMVLRQRVRREQQQREELMMAAIMLANDQRRRRAIWIRPWLARRPQLGQYETLMHVLMRESPHDFKGFIRMEPCMFHELVQRVGPTLLKREGRRPPLVPGLKLAVTLRFLATGNSYRSLAFGFRVAHNTISKFIPEVCDAIVAEYEDEVFKTPSTPEAWLQVEDRFSKRWNFHHACGAIDGKHIAIKKPDHSGSQYFNYKGFFSIVLLAIVDGDYKFVWVNIGANGSASDCGIYNRSPLEVALREGTLGFPDAAPLPHDDVPIPYFFVGDDAFPLRPYMMKPYAHRYQQRDERIFSYRLSRARRVVENAFGILAHRFRCLLTTLAMAPPTAIKITQTCVVLHNLMRGRYPNLQNQDLDIERGDGGYTNGAWRGNALLTDLAKLRGSPDNREGKEVRCFLKHYYNSQVGRVAWQDDIVD